MKKLLFLLPLLFCFTLATTAQENDKFECSDGIDNDGDGLIDCDDNQCQFLPNDGCQICGSGISFADVTIGYFPQCGYTFNPDNALGVANYAQGQSYVTLGQGGSIQLGFTNNLITNSGNTDPDIWVFEIGPIVEACYISLRPYNAYTIAQLQAFGIPDADQNGFYEIDSILGSTSSVEIDKLFPGIPGGNLKFDAIEIIDIIDDNCSGGVSGADIDAVCALSSVALCNLALAGSVTPIRCKGSTKGRIRIAATMGTGPFTYEWNTGSLAQEISNLDPGTYTVTVTDVYGCENNTQFTLNDLDKLSTKFTLQEVNCGGASDGMIIANALGGTPPYSFQWSNGATTPTINALGVGEYSLSLTDAVGCCVEVAMDLGSNCCQLNYCAEAALGNLDICTVLSSDPNHPLDPLDCDKDGVTNTNECSDGTDPLDPCDFVDTSITLPVTADQTGCPLPRPDLTPTMIILPANISGTSVVEVAIKITELGGEDTDGSVISVRVASDPRFVFIWDISLTQAALEPVQNSDWNYLGDNGIFHTWVFNASGLVIPANGQAAFGFQSFYDPQSTNGQTTISAAIVPYSGGENNLINNTDSERLVYFN